MEKLEKSKVEGHVIRITRDLTKEEVSRDVEALKAAVANGDAARIALARLAECLK
jgi:hypothetical protein